jgi:hypothetical protein
MGSEFNPMQGTMVLVQRLRTSLGLPDPDRADAPEGEWAEIWQKDSGVPDEEELAAMERRLGALREKHGTFDLVIFPILENKELDVRDAEELASMLQKKEVCGAHVIDEGLLLQPSASPSQLRRLWDMARGFQEHLRDNGLDADYALYAEYMLDPEAERVFAVNYVLCDRAGEWILVDLQNSHHADFQSIDPKTASCCNQLVVRRLEGHLASR